jgi:hypothetical protein
MYRETYMVKHAQGNMHAEARMGKQARGNTHRETCTVKHAQGKKLMVKYAWGNTEGNMGKHT